MDKMFFFWIYTPCLLLICNSLRSNLIIKDVKQDSWAMSSLFKCIFSGAEKLLYKAPSSILSSVKNLEPGGNKTSKASILYTNDVFVSTLMTYNAVVVMKLDGSKNDSYLNSSETVPNYIIEVKNIEDFKKELKTIEKVVLRYPTGAKFFFIINNSTEQFRLEFVRDILRGMWQDNVFNVLMMQQDANTQMYNFYGWFPYKGGSCDAKFDIVDRCSMGKFENNGSLVIDRIPQTFNRCVIKVGVYNEPSSVIDIKNSTYGSRKKYFITNGFEVDMMNTIAQQFKLRMLYLTPEFPGNMNEIGITPRMIESLKEGRYDLILGNFGYIAERMHMFQLTDTYHSQILHLCVPKFTFSNFHNIYSYSLILVLLAFIFLVVVTYFSGRYQNANHTFADCFFKLIGIAVGVSIPHRYFWRKVRLPVGALLILSLFMTNAYQTILTSSLTKKRTNLKIKTVSDVVEQNLKLCYTPSLDPYIQDLWNEESLLPYLIRSSSTILVDNLTTCYERIIYGDTVSIFRMEYFKFYSNQDKSEKQIYCIKNSLGMYFNVLMMRNGFPLFEKFNKIIQLMRHSGLLLKWIRDSVKEDLTKDDAGGNNIDFIENKFETLRLDNFLNAFKLLGFGYLAALAVLILESLSFINLWINGL